MTRTLQHIKNQRPAILLTLLYTTAIIIFSSFHELWRDEVVLMSFVADHPSLGGLLGALKNYGHPPLFHILVALGYKVVPSYAAVKVINIIICVAAVYLFLLKAPFSWMQKILFIGGVMPFYNYPVINRNYGLSMLLLFIVCILYKNRFKHIIPFAIALFLLAHVHAHSFVIVLAIALSMLFELLFVRENVRDQRPRPLHLGLGALVLVLTIGSFVLFCSPQKSSLIFTVDSLTWSKIIKALCRALIIPGKAFNRIFGFENSLFVNVIIFSTYIYLARKAHLFVLFFSGVCMLSMFHDLVYTSEQLRHHASLYLLMILVFWIDHYYSKENNIPIQLLKRIQTALSASKTPLFTFILIIHVCMGYAAIKEDITSPYSSSRDFARLLKQSPVLENSIIMAEPGAMLEALPYYLDNKLYIYREARFGKVRNFTDEIKTASSMTYLIQSAQELQRKTNQKIIILLDKRVTPGGPYLVDLPYNCSFEYSEASLKSFANLTQKLATFDGALTDENYNVYLLK